MTSLGFICNQRTHLECKYEGALKGTVSSLGFKHQAGNKCKRDRQVEMKFLSPRKVKLNISINTYFYALN